jgi:hypothetical protein
MAGLLMDEELLPFFGNPNIQRQGARARALAAQRDVNTLPDPRTYAAISGLLGQAPDELGFSVLNPAYEDIQRVGRPAFAVGTALGVAPMMRAMNLAPRPAARAASGRSQRGSVRVLGESNQFPQAEAMRLAQQRAALPIEQGGLGLPPNNTALDRATAMGFNTDTFHATNYDIAKLDKSFLGSNTAAKSAKQGYFSAGHPRTTYAYIDNGVTGPDAVMSLLYGKSFNQIEKELLEYATSKNLKPYQVRDEFYENLPNKHIQSLQALKNARASILKEIPGAKLMGRHVPNMDKASPQQLKALANFDDQIEELKALEDMVIRQQNMTNEIDDIAEVAENKLMSGANIMPLKINTSNANVYDDLNTGFRQDTFANRMTETIENLKDLAIIKNTQDGFKKSDTIYGVVNPDIVRSRFAAFDPLRKTAATATAAGLAAPDLLAGGLMDDEERRRMYRLSPGLLGD